MPVDYCHRDTHRHRTRGALRLVPSVSVAVAVAAWVVGCGEGETRPPVAVGSIPELWVGVGSIESADLAGYFSDPDGDELSYEASSSNAEVATVAIQSDPNPLQGDVVAVTGVASGSTEITVTASDGSFAASQDFTASVHADREVLEILYDELGGDGWRGNTHWKTDKPLREWYAVTTNSDGRVSGLDLHHNSLTGEIPAELGSLSDLRILHLFLNSLTGEIPPELGDLSNLERLDIYSNSLTGEIPLDFLDLSSLQGFHWDDNDGLCAPDTSEFDDWLDGIPNWQGPRCD